MGVEVVENPDGIWIASDRNGSQRGLGWTREEAIDDLVRRASLSVSEPRKPAELVMFRGTRQ